MSKFITLFFLLFLLTGCGSKTYKVGFIGSLSGSGAPLGANGRNGALLYFDELNKSGGINGRRVELIEADVQSMPDKTGECIEDVYNKGAAIVIGHLTSGEGLEAQIKANQLKIPMISATISGDNFSGLDDYLFRITSSNDYQGKYLGAYAKKIGYKTVNIIYDIDNKSFAEVIMNSFLNELGNDKRVLNSIILNNDQKKDLNEVADILYKDNADVILAINDSVTNAKLCQVLRKKKVTSRVMMSAWSIMGALIENGGESVEDTVHVSLFLLHDNEPSYQKFKNKYFEVYNEYPNFSGLFGYESAQYAAEVLKRVKNNDVLTALKSIKTFQGVQQQIGIDEFGDGVRELYLYTIKNGQFKRIE